MTIFKEASSFCLGPTTIISIYSALSVFYLHLLIMSATLDLAIMTRVAAGSGLTIHQPHEEQYTYAAIAIATAVGMLKHQATRGVLVNIALIYDTTRCGDQLFGRDPRLAVQAVDNFIRKIDSRFPMVTIERRLTNLDCIAYHDRCEWEGTQQSWDPRSSMVGLNTVVRTWYFFL